ncbi:MAG: hypothetical protein WD229_07730 [Pirellulales bacterium]
MTLSPPRQAAPKRLRFSIQTLFCLLTMGAALLGLLTRFVSPLGGEDIYLYLFLAMPILAGSCSLLGARLNRAPRGPSDRQLQLGGLLLSAAGILLAIWTAMAVVLAISLLGWVDKP